MIELYELHHAGAIQYFTSATQDVRIGAKVYLARPIDRRATENTQDAIKSMGAIVVSPESEIGVLAMNPPIGDRILLSIFEYNQIDPPSQIYEGLIAGGEWADHQVTVKLSTIIASQSRSGLRECFTKECRHSVYSTNCQAPIVINTMTVSAVDGAVIKISEALENAYQYGLLKHGSRSYMIQMQVGSELTLMRQVDVKAGAQVELLKGCDWSIQCCHQRFNNAENFGGNPLMPTKNPYIGDPINR